MDDRTIDNLVSAFSGIPNEQLSSAIYGYFSESGLSNAEKDAIVTVVARSIASKSVVASIPGWSTWNETQADTWYQTNIRTPFADATTLAAMKIVIGTIITALWSVIRIVIALRDRSLRIPTGGNGSQAKS